MIDFLKYRWLYFLISLTIISVGLFSIIKWGYRFSIEFTGGTNIEMKLEKSVGENTIKEILKKEKIVARDLKLNNTLVNIQTEFLEQGKIDSLKKNLEKELKQKIIINKTETFGSTVSQEMIKKTIIAAFLSTIGILLFIFFSFRSFNYALAAVLAMFHDMMILFGIYSLFSHFFLAEFDTMFVTSVLTTMSFSVHDTIVIIDKIREYYQEEGKEEIEYYANKALTETMVRSLNNSMTIIFMLFSLVILGGVTIRFFSLSLLVGTIVGTYSSPFVATPIVVFLEKRKQNAKN